MEGDSIWCPLGWMPVVTGIRRDVQWDAQDVKIPSKKTENGAIQRHPLCYGCSLMYGTEFMTMAPTAVRVNLASMWVKVAAMVPGSLKNSEDAQTWFSSLKEEVKDDD